MNRFSEPRTGGAHGCPALGNDDWEACRSSRAATRELNGCGYCVSAHGTLGKLAGMSPDDIEAARTGRGANAREQAILALIRRVVRTGGAGAGTDLARAREAGLSEAEVMEVLAHMALKTFTNAVSLVAQVDIDFPKQPRLPEA